MQNRLPSDHAGIGEAEHIPTSVPTHVFSLSPIIVSAPERPVDLQMRISFPVTGDHLPIILLSHGHGQSNHLSSLNGYAPLANFWAAHGFIVIQPTHLSSKTLSLDPNTDGAPLFWRSRVMDMKLILDQLDAIEASIPQLAGRLNKDRIAVVGHSLGGHTAGMLLGAQLTEHKRSAEDWGYPLRRAIGAEPLPCLYFNVKDTNSRTAPLSLNRAVALFLGSYRVGNRAAFSDSRSNFHTRVGYRTNVCRRRLASDLARASETNSCPRSSRGSP